MKTWSEFYPDVLPLVPGCPIPTVDFNLRRAAQDWCDKTLCWRAWLDDVTTSADVTAYDFEVSNGQDIVQLLRATLDGKNLPVITADDLPANWRTSSAFCERGIFTLDRASFNLVPTPAAGLVVQTEVALQPSNTATGIDDQVFSQYVNEIALGALARMHMMPGQPWSFAGSAAPSQFKQAIADAASAIWHAHSRAPSRVRAQFL